MIIDTIYVFILTYIGLYDINHKIITNKSNMILAFTCSCAYIFENIKELSFQSIFFKIMTIIFVSIFLILIRKYLKYQIGGGDIKMLIALFCRFDFSKFMTLIFISLISACIYSLYLIFIKKKDIKYKFAFGQFIALGAIVVLFIN